MFSNRLDGDPFFARIRSMDMECPRCGEVYYCHARGGAYRPRLGRFYCPSCGLILAVGVVVYPVTTAAYHGTPPDWKPSYRQALALRNQMSGFLKTSNPEDRKGIHDQHNVVIREGCTCQLSGRGLIVHPGCPVHGRPPKL